MSDDDDERMRLIENKINELAAEHAADEKGMLRDRIIALERERDEAIKMLQQCADRNDEIESLNALVETKLKRAIHAKNAWCEQSRQEYKEKRQAQAACDELRAENERLSEASWLVINQLSIAVKQAPNWREPFHKALDTFRAALAKGEASCATKDS